MSFRTGFLFLQSNIIDKQDSCHTTSLISSGAKLYLLVIFEILFINDRDTGRRFPAAEWLTHSHATLEVTDLRPTFGGISEIISGIDTVSSTEGHEVVCKALQELPVTCIVSGDNW